MRNPIPYGRQDINASDRNAVNEVLLGEWLTTGPAVDKLEADLLGWTGNTPTIVVSSGTAALHTAYAAIGLGPGDEIITPPITFVATQAAAVHLGAVPVFADVQPDTATIDPEKIESLITSRTVAIVAVDYAGHPAEYDEIRSIADRHGLLLVQDAAHSLGSSYRGRPVGSIADLTTFSFFPTKNITTGEGGAISIKDSDTLMRARRFARQGLVKDEAEFVIESDGPWHQEVHEFGLNYRLPDMLAALGSQQLTRLNEFKQKRKDIKAEYDSAFRDLANVKLPVQREYVDPVWHFYPLRVNAEIRKAVFTSLRRAGIGVQVNYWPSYRHPAFQALLESPPNCPVSEQFYSQEISLPMYSLLTEEELNYIILTVRSLLTNKSLFRF
jgi:dTDP-4-amino-4,6-dideoxygalactose transaminase